jgi:hypothetical protein
MTVSYNTVTLTDPSPFDIEWLPIINEVVLISGKRSIQASSATAIRVAFKCQTTSLAEITTLKGFIGSSYTLTIDGTSYMKCFISNLSYNEVLPGLYAYTISFIQDTT